ncbi:ABC transporter permease [Natronolimnohabitans innermongolicus]|uniref:Copper ABC transporter permease n=1 Tax=Natronolimnohabitans innermongolicus JCM 12255 TaxID=1227499 RepID=L9XBV8_9EURY|nr:ABC transporter permease [Natronolimnohabitans innermongolicus]ELY58921.1 copper ABC transporter permease [Natronolimnohabitans innermongolicus JCM 12255]
MSDELSTSSRSTPVQEAETRTAPDSRHRLKTIVGRELRTVVRTRTFFVLALAFAAVVLGIAAVGESIQAGYVPTLVDLLTPLELLVPVLAVAFGYRAILGDEQRGELDVLETYPVSSRELVLGVYLGRAIGLVVTVVVPLAIVAVAVAVTEGSWLSIYATHSGADSPVLFGRFVVLTALFALSVLAVAIAISSVVSGTRSALALAVVALVVLLVGIDLAIAYGFSIGVIGDSELVYTLAVSPLSAFRGLVFESAVVVASGTGPDVAAPLSSLVSLVGWTVGSLALATWALDR